MVNQITMLVLTADWRLMQGHFQIVLNNEHCPLFQKDLGWYHRLMYCSGVWAYIVGAVTTPMFIIIPLVSFILPYLTVLYVSLISLNKQISISAQLSLHSVTTTNTQCSTYYRL